MSYQTETNWMDELDSKLRNLEELEEARAKEAWEKHVVSRPQVFPRSHVRLSYINIYIYRAIFVKLNHSKCSHPNIRRLLRRSKLISEFSAVWSRCNNESITWSRLIIELQTVQSNIIIVIICVNFKACHKYIAIFNGCIE